MVSVPVCRAPARVPLVSYTPTAPDGDGMESCTFFIEADDPSDLSSDFSVDEDDRTMLQNHPDLITLVSPDSPERTTLNPTETIVRPHLPAEWLRGVRGIEGAAGAAGGGESKAAAVAEDEDKDTAKDESTCAICYVPHAAGDLIETCASNTQRMHDGGHRVCRECLRMYVEHSLGNTLVRRAFKCPDYGCDAELREEAVRRRVYQWYLCNYRKSSVLVVTDMYTENTEK